MKSSVLRLRTDTACYTIGSLYRQAIKARINGLVDYSFIH